MSETGAPPSAIFINNLPGKFDVKKLSPKICDVFNTLYMSCILMFTRNFMYDYDVTRCNDGLAAECRCTQDATPVEMEPQWNPDRGSSSGEGFLKKWYSV